MLVLVQIWEKKNIVREAHLDNDDYFYEDDVEGYKKSINSEIYTLLTE